jgi:hypothetical protein
MKQVVTLLTSISAFREVDAIIMQLMKKDPGARSASELASIGRYLVKHSFFLNLRKETDDETLKECAKYIYTSTCQAGEVTPT